MLRPDDREALHDLAPVLRRAVALDPAGLARIRLTGEAAMVLVRLPFGVLVSRTIRAAARPDELDVTLRAADVLAWLDGVGTALPAHDAAWRTGLPPVSGWRRIETVPEQVVRDLVRRGAAVLQDAAAREGVPGAQPRAAVTDALLDSVVLTVHDDAGRTAEVSLRALTAITRMGFLPPGSHVYVDAVGRWVRIVAEHGTVYLERPGLGLVLH